MKFKLSTLLLIVAAIACAIGWFSELRRSQIARAKWEMKEAELKAEFAKMTTTMYSGSSALASAEVANDILARLAPLVPANKNDPFAFDTDREFVDQVAIKIVFNLWQNEQQIQDSMYAVVPPKWHPEISEYMALELAQPQLELLGISNTLEIINRGQELNVFLDRPFPRDRRKKLTLVQKSLSLLTAL